MAINQESKLGFNSYPVNGEEPRVVQNQKNLQNQEQTPKKISKPKKSHPKSKFAPHSKTLKKMQSISRGRR
ncbi:hypothetical protein G4B88_014961 [Cannabis sativa]|uniref:Uncharacterized protein n=1 Tax=Cannabis sativa TaxID=3483 RepID=A0A7J6EZZ0_CANSA|nr:hypothetical protein G4B88_014961 [Cannabis sativa]